MHLYSTNEVVDLHNKSMLKLLNQPVAHCYAAEKRQLETSQPKNDQLSKKILLCIDQRVILRSNLWVGAGLINGSLGIVRAIVYSPGCTPPELPSFEIGRASCRERVSSPV